MSMNESQDCEVLEVIKQDVNEVIARIATRLEDRQFEYFSKNAEYLISDLHSSKARLGINQERISPFEINNQSIQYEARFWFFIPEYAVGLGIHELITPGLKIGKIYLKNPRLKYSAEELINLISNRIIIVPKGTRVTEEGVLIVPVMPFIHRPNYKILTKDYLMAAIQKKIPREDLYFAQPETRVAKVTVPPQSGVISHTSIFTQQNEIYILDEDHSDARVGSKHTNGIIYLELVGSEKEVVKEHIRCEVFKPASASSSLGKPFFIDQLSGKIQTLYDGKEVDDRHAVVFHNGRQVQTIDLTKPYGGFLKDLAPKSSLVFKHFPNQLLASYLIVAADMGLIKEMTFQKAPEETFFFSSENLAIMKVFSEMGVMLYWKNKLHGDLVLYKQFFMRSSIIPSFNEAYESRKLAAIYGTAGAVDTATQAEIVAAIKSFKEFHGGICGILTGGNTGGITSFVSTATASLGMLSGAVYWKIPGVDIEPYIDFAAYLGRNDLLERQEILSDTTEADIYFKGGVGTNLENAITFVKKKLGIGHYKPQIFVGKFYLPLKKWLDHLVAEKTVDASVFNNCYFIDKGEDIFKTLCTHFGSEDKMIHEITKYNSEASR